MHSDCEITALKVRLAIDALHEAGILRLRVFGTSMIPSVWPGDFVSVARAAISDIPPGALVLYTRQDRLFLHRVIGNEGSVLTVRGDALPDNDQPVLPGQVLGHVVGIRRRGLWIAPKGTLNCFQKLLSRLVCRSNRFRILVLRLNTLRRRLIPA